MQTTKSSLDYETKPHCSPFAHLRLRSPPTTLPISPFTRTAGTDSTTGREQAVQHLLLVGYQRYEDKMTALEQGTSESDVNPYIRVPLEFAAVVDRDSDVWPAPCSLVALSRPVTVKLDERVTPIASLKPQSFQVAKDARVMLEKGVEVPLDKLKDMDTSPFDYMSDPPSNLSAWAERRHPHAALANLPTETANIGQKRKRHPTPEPSELDKKRLKVEDARKDRDRLRGELFDFDEMVRSGEEEIFVLEQQMRAEKEGVELDCGGA